MTSSRGERASPSPCGSRQGPLGSAHAPGPLGQYREGHLRSGALNELATLRFLDAHAHVTIVAPVGVGKTFLAHALGHIACRRGATVLAVRTDQMLKTLKHARLDNSYEPELRKLVAVDLVILDDFAIDVLDPVESRDLYDLLLERYRTGSVIVTSNRGPDEVATFADSVRAHRAIDRFTSNAYDLVIEGESNRPRLEPRLAKDAKDRSR